MTQKFISRQKSQSPTTSPPVQTSRLASRPFAEPVQQKAQQPDLQTILQRSERAGNPTEKMAWGNTQPEVQRQGVTENETEESKVQKQAESDTQSQDLEEQKDSEVQTQLDSTIQQQESQPEEETVQKQSSPEEEQKNTEVQTQLDSTIQPQESSNQNPKIDSSSIESSVIQRITEEDAIQARFTFSSRATAHGYTEEMLRTIMVHRFNEITPGNKQSMLIGQGTEEGYGKSGQILYNCTVNADGIYNIHIFHAHGQGKIG